MWKVSNMCGINSITARSRYHENTGRFDDQQNVQSLHEYRKNGCCRVVNHVYRHIFNACYTIRPDDLTTSQVTIPKTASAVVMHRAIYIWPEIEVHRPIVQRGSKELASCLMWYRHKMQLVVSYFTSFSYNSSGHNRVHSK